MLPLENSPVRSREYVSEKGKSHLSIIIKILLTFQTPRPHSENRCSNKCPSTCSNSKVRVPQTGDRKCLWRLRGGWVWTRAALVESLSVKQLNPLPWVPSLSCYNEVTACLPPCCQFTESLNADKLQTQGCQPELRKTGWNHAWGVMRSPILLTLLCS